MAKKIKAALNMNLAPLGMLHQRDRGMALGLRAVAFRQIAQLVNPTGILYFEKFYKHCKIE